MRNVKIEQGLDGDQHWPFIATLTIEGNPDSPPIIEGMTQFEIEDIIQSWEEIAVFKITPDVETYFGFIVDGRAQYLNVPVETEDGKFGVHIGDRDVTYITFTKDMITRPTLGLVERTTIHDAKYATLPLY